jgi:hypothetical protein
MVLSNVEIHKALDEGRLIISPEPNPRHPTSANPDCPYNTTSVDLRLGKTLSIPKGGPFSYDLRKPASHLFLVKIVTIYQLIQPADTRLKLISLSSEKR